MRILKWDQKMRKMWTHTLARTIQMVSYDGEEKRLLKEMSKQDDNRRGALHSRRLLLIVVGGMCTAAYGFF